jgi:hypothetical protein
MLAFLLNLNYSDIDLPQKNQAAVKKRNHKPNHLIFGWVATEKARVGELNHEFSLPHYNRY